MATILDGKALAEELYKKLPNMHGKELAIITIGDDPASKVYVRNKIKACEKVGLIGKNYKFPSDVEAKEIAHLIFNKLNPDDNVVGIMIQQPYPKELKDYGLENYILKSKDVDGLTCLNMYSTLSGKIPEHYPATPKGIMTLLEYYDISLERKNIVIIGRSDIVGKPLAAMMTAKNATVTLCHSKTPYHMLKEHTRRADIIITAVGKAKYFNGSYLFQPNDSYSNPIIIDVGINRDENGKLCGDVDYEDILPYVSSITPVPGGIGPMTVYSLIENCCKNS